MGVSDEAATRATPRLGDGDGGRRRGRRPRPGRVRRRRDRRDARGGIGGFYPGGVAIAFRQATNWASRQGFTEIVREKARTAIYGDAEGAKLTKWEEVGCGIVGGTLASWNHPFEVARIEAQSRGNAGIPTGNMVSVMRDIVKPLTAAR